MEILSCKDSFQALERLALELESKNEWSLAKDVEQIRLSLLATRYTLIRNTGQIVKISYED